MSLRLDHLRGRLDRLRNQLFPSAQSRQCARNAGFNTSAHVVQLILLLVTTPIYVFYLGQEEFGLWMLVNGYIGFGNLVGFGLTDATIKFVSSYAARKDMQGVAKVIRTTLAMYLLMGALCAAAAMGASRWLAFSVLQISDELREVATLALRIGGIGILARLYWCVHESALQGLERFDVSAKAAALSRCITAAINIVLVTRGASVIAVLSVQVGMFAACGLLEAILLRAFFVPCLVPIPLVDRTVLRETLSFGFYRWLQSAVGILNNNLDRFLVASFAGVKSVTVYTISLQVARQAHVLLTVASAFLFPMSSRLKEAGDSQELLTIYRQSSRIIVIAAAALIVPVFILGRSILTVWIGADFADQASGVLRILCLRYALLPIGIVTYNFLLGLNMVRLQSLLTLMSAPCITLGMVLLSRYGTIGIAGAWLVGLPFALAGRLVVSKRLFGRHSLFYEVSCILPVFIPLALSAWAVVMRYDAALVTTSIWNLLFQLGTAACLCAAVAFAIGSLVDHLCSTPCTNR